jgi:hypothetical protein
MRFDGGRTLSLFQIVDLCAGIVALLRRSRFVHRIDAILPSD